MNAALKSSLAGDPLPITTFASKTTTAGKRHETSWPKLCADLCNAKERPTKDALPLMKAGVFANDSRAKGSEVETLSAICGDYDEGHVSIEEAQQRLLAASIKSILYTTPSHTPGVPRWRCVASLSEAISPDKHSELVDLLNGALGGILAPESWNVKQCYYYGRVRGVEYKTAVVDGEPLDSHALIGPSWPSIGKPSAKSKAPAAALAPSEAAVTAAEAEDMYARLATRDRDQWLSGLGSVHRATGGGPDALARAATASAPYWNANGTSEYASCADEIAAKWREFEPVTVVASKDMFDVLPDDVAESTKREPLKRFTLAEIKNELPWSNYLIRDLLPQTELVSVYGPSGAGKSFVVFHMALAIARGVERWAGRKVAKGRVLWIAFEAFGSMKPRALAYEIAHGVQLEDIPDFEVIAAASLIDKEKRAQLFESIKGERYDLVVADTLAAASAGLDENRSEVNEVLDACRDIHRMTGATVLIIDHAGKDVSKGSRGWSGKKATMQAELKVEQEEGSDLRTLITTKNRDGEDGTGVTFRLKPVKVGQYADGDPRFSACVEVVSEAERKQVDRRKRGARPAADSWDACVLAAAEKQSEKWFLSDELRAAARLEVSKEQKKAANDTTALNRAIDRLKGQGWLLIDDAGRYKFNPEDLTDDTPVGASRASS